jgi:VIT1/CCC1 family predicted Fe2+/Mn2+ transporter
VITQEIGHQWHMMEQIADKRLYIVKVKEAIPGMTTGIFFVIGALPVLAPFLIGTMWDSNPTIPAIIAFVLAVISISIAGLFMAVLSGKRISTNIMHNLLIIMGTAALTYLVGLTARLSLGIVH